ncbi:short chain dehydrogenase [Microbacterium sp. B2969]|uniref:Short chain dehydrogenase n=1 Tax=Microbacterium alkaliflavum TaxID=3248839 RepID=A0ABW7QCE9_9MICO
MRILLVGASGTIGRLVYDTLRERGHDVVTVGRSSGDVRCDVTDPVQVEELWSKVGEIDAVVSTAGHVRYAPLAELTSDDFAAAFADKALAQINLVRTGLEHLAPKGSFTLISGIPSRDPVVSGAAAAAVNGAIEAFARAAAIEIAPRRINVISPSVLEESLEAFGDFFPGFEPVAGAEVARAFVKSVEGAATGQILALP